MDPAWKFIIDMTSTLNTMLYVQTAIRYQSYFVYLAMRQSEFKQTYLCGYVLAQCSHIFKIFEVTEFHSFNKIK